MIEGLSNISSSDLPLLEAVHKKSEDYTGASFEEFITNVDQDISETIESYSSSNDIFPEHDFKKMYLEKLVDEQTSVNKTDAKVDPSSSSSEPITNVLLNFENISKTATSNVNTSDSITKTNNTSSVSSSKSAVPSSSTISNSKYDSIIQTMADKYNVPFDLIKRVINAESAFNSNATSSVGAMGLMQLMPATAKWLGVSNAYSPTQNIEGGTKYLSQLLKKYDGNNKLAVAAYNAGPGNVDKYGGVPPFKETQNYVKKILG